MSSELIENLIVERDNLRRLADKSYPNIARELFELADDIDVEIEILQIIAEAMAEDAA